MGRRRDVACALTAVLAVGLWCGPVKATNITLEVSSSTPTVGSWSAGELVEIIICATSDGAANQGFFGGDFKAGDFAINVLDPNCLLIHDVLALAGSFQVDTESFANSFDDPNGNYHKADDTWVYDDFTDFTGDVVMTPQSFEASATAQLSAGYGLGLGSAVDFLHIVLEIQPGFASGESSLVQFYGQLGAYNTSEGDTTSNIFGSDGGAINSGTFAITIIPEPAAMSLLAVGACLPLLRRRRRK